MDIGILGTPFNGLRKTPYTFENPAAELRRLNLVRSLKARGYQVYDSGDLIQFQFQEIRDGETGILDLEQWVQLSFKLSVELSGLLKQNRFPLILGGDCAMLPGIFRALTSRNMGIGLVYLDGHADFHTPATSPTGDPADMALAVLSGRGSDRITKIGERYPLISDEDVVVYGIRAWDGIDESKIAVYDRELVARRGVRTCVTEGLQLLTNRNLSLWLHVDVDVLDPSIMPVMYPEPNGLTLEETHDFLHHVWASGHVIGLSIACYHPMLDPDGRAGRRVIRLIVDMLS